MPSQFPFKLISLLFLFLIIEMSSQVLFVLQFKLICLFLCFLLITTPSQFVSMFVLSSFAFSSLRCRSRSHHHLDNILGSICVHFYFLRFPIIGMSSQVLCRLMFVLFITYHWNAFLGFLYVYYQFPQFPILVPLVYLHQDAIVGSIYVQFQFLWFPFIGMPSQFLSKLSHFFLWFAITRTPFQLHLCSKLVPLVSDRGDEILGFYLSLASCFFGFSLLKHHPSFYLYSFLVPLIFQHLDFVLGSSYVYC